jgi:hypothetical protein
MTKEIQGKRRFAIFPCCYYCGVPQSIFLKWKVKGIDVGYAEDKSVECQYKEVVIPTVAVALAGMGFRGQGYSMGVDRGGFSR